MNPLQFSLLEDNEISFPSPNYFPSSFQTSINPFFQKLFIEEDEIPILPGASNDYSESLIKDTNSQSKKNSDSDSYDDSVAKQIKTEHPIFHTEKNHDLIQKGIEQKLLMNRLSAKKSRQKKKIYIKKLEEESANFKNQMCLSINDNNLSDGKNKNFFNRLRLIENQENEIRTKGQKQSIDIMKQYELLEKTTIVEMLVKQINLLIPLRFRIFGEKNIKLLKFFEDDSLSVINTKIDENIEKINNYMEVVSKKRIKPVIKLLEIYNNLKNFVSMFQLMFSQNF